MSLPLLPPRDPLEGPLGYLARLAYENGLPIAALRNMIAAAEVEAPAGFVDFDKLAPAFNRRWLRYCPYCLSRGSTWRLGWELRFADACPGCGNWLLDTCAACDAPQTWNRAALIPCQECGEPLDHAEQRQAPDALVRLSGALEDRGRGLPSAHLGMLSGLSALEVVSLVRLLGAYGSRQGHRVPQKIVDADRLAVSWAISSVAAEILAAWPRGFHDLLGGLYRETSSVQSRSLRGAFGGLYRALYRAFKQPAFGFLRDAFEEFVAESWSGAIGRRNTRLDLGVLDRLTWVPPRAARQMFGITPAYLNRLVADGVVAEITRFTASGRSFQMVRKGDVQASRRDTDRYVTLEFAAKQLGLKRQRLSRLLPVICPEADKDAASGVPWHVPRVWLDDWLGRIRTYKPVALPAPDHLTSLEHLLRFGGSNDASIGLILRAIQRDELRPAGVVEGDRRLSALFFHACDLDALLQPCGADDNSCWLTVPRAAESLGVKQEVAYHLIRAGLLEATLSRHRGRAASRVHRTDIEVFERRYVLGREIARVCGVSPKAVVLRLKEIGVLPVSGPGVDGSRQVVYERSTIEAVINALPQDAGGPDQKLRGD